MDQVYLYFEKCMKSELEQQRKDAITLANALVYTTPVSDKSDLRKKERSWKSFIDSLDVDKIKSKKEKKQTIGDVKKMFGALGMNVPMIAPKKDSKGDE